MKPESLLQVLLDFLGAVILGAVILALMCAFAKWVTP